MSQQGGSPTGHEDDWWGQLYDEATEDTGPTPVPDTLDDRFASAAGAVGAADNGEAGATPSPPRAGIAPQRTPWDPSPAMTTDEPAPSASEGPAPSASEGPAPTGSAGSASTGSAGPASTASAGSASTGSAGPASTASPGPAPTAPASPAPTASAGPATIASPVDGHTSTETPAATPPDPTASTRTASTRTASTRTASTTDAAAPGTPVPDPQRAEEDPLDDSAPAAQGTRAATRTATRMDLPNLPPGPLDYVGSGPPTYEAEPTALPPADPDDLDDLVADTVLDGARYGACTLRAASVRGDSARYRGEPRRDSLLTARFGTGDQALILVAMATGARATPGAHRAAAEACHWIGRAVGRSHARLAEDIRAARRGDLKSGLHRLTDRSLGKLRASAAEQGIEPEEYAATLRCLLLPADPECRTRVFFGVGAGGLFRLRDGDWQDIEPRVTETTGDPVVGFGSLPAETPEGDRLTMDLGIPTPPSPYEPAPEPPHEPFRFRASVAHPGDALLMCTEGLAEPLRGEPDLCRHLASRWCGPTPPGLATFLADTQIRVKGYADDRTAAAVWEA